MERVYARSNVRLICCLPFLITLQEALYAVDPSSTVVMEASKAAAESRDVKPKITCTGRNQPIISRQRAVSGSPDRAVRFTTAAASERPSNHRRSLSEIGKSTHLGETYKNLKQRSRSVDIDLRQRSAFASSPGSRVSSSSHQPRKSEQSLTNSSPSSSSSSHTRSISFHRPIAWFRKRWLFHQLSDSGILLSDRSINMHQDRKMVRSSSVAEVDIKPQLIRPSNEVRRSKNQKQGPHPKKKMLRSHSESAIDVNVLRNAMRHSTSTPSDGDKPAGVICSNEDFKKILTESKRHQFGRKRHNTMVIQLEPTPEVPLEGDIQLDNRFSEKEESSSPKFELEERSNDTVTKLPMRQCAGSDPNSPAHMSSGKLDNLRLSPLMVHKNNVNNASNIRATVHLSPKALSSRLAKCNAHDDELEPMLPKDKNGNNLIEENQFVDELVIEEKDSSDTENISTDNDSENAVPAESPFDAQLLGEAIERHLAKQKESTSPGRKSPRYNESRKRSGSLRSLLGQNNSQISARLGNLISRFPFKRDGSVSPTNSESGVTV